MEVQISHSPKDRKFVDELSEHLWQLGVQARRDYLKSPEAFKNPERLNHDLRRYDFVIPVLSPAYMQDDWLQLELLQSMVREQVARVTFVLPVLIQDCDVPVLLRERVVDFRDRPIAEAFRELAESLSGPRQVFVIMKFGDARLDSMYHLVIKSLVQEFGLSALRIDEVQDSGFITDQILKQIERSAVVLADLTGERPNCYYEAGYAHAMGKDLILTVQKGSKVHFDLAGHRFIEWETEKELRDALRVRFQAILARHRR